MPTPEVSHAIGNSARKINNVSSALDPCSMDGCFSYAAAAEAVEFYKKMYDDCAPPGHSDAYMVANLDAYKSGQVAFQMNWSFLFLYIHSIK